MVHVWAYAWIKEINANSIHTFVVIMVVLTLAVILGLATIALVRKKGICYNIECRDLSV